MEKTQTRNMSAQLVPFLVLLGALFVVGLYVVDLDLETEVKTAEQSQLPQEAANPTTGLIINYPDDWTVQETQNGGLLFEEEDRNEDDELLQIDFGVIDQVLNEVTSNSGDVEFEPFRLRNTERAAVAFKQELPEETSPGRPERIDYVILMESGDQRTVVGVLSTNENDIDDYQELFEGMARSVRIDESIIVVEELPEETVPEEEVAYTIDFETPESLTVQEQQGAYFFAKPTNPQFGQIIPGSLDQLGSIFQLPPGERTPEELLNELLSGATAGGVQVIDPVAEQTYGDTSGYAMTVSSVNPQTQAESYTYVGIFRYQETTPYLLVIFADAISELENGIAGIETILETLTVSEDQASEDAEGAEEETEPAEEVEGDAETSDEGTDAREGTEDAVDSEETEDTGAAEETEPAEEVEGDAETSDAGEEPAAVEVVFGETVTNDAGYSVSVPEGFSGAADAEFIVLNRGNDEIRVAVVPQDELLGFIGNTLNLPVDELPSDNLAETLITEASNTFPDAGDVMTEDGGAYVDYVAFGESHRVYMEELADGRILYADTSAFAQNADEVGAMLLATVDTVELSEATADEETEDSEEATGDSEEAEQATEDTEGDETSADTDEEAETSEDAETSDAGEAVDVTFEGTHINQDAGFRISVPEGYEAVTVEGVTVVEGGNSSLSLEVVAEDDLLDFINETFGLELDELPNNDIAINVMNRFADVQAPDVDVVSGVSASDDGNRAYVDLGNLGRTTRYMIEMLDDGRVLYGVATALGQDFADVGAALLAIVNDITFSE